MSMKDSKKKFIIKHYENLIEKYFIVCFKNPFNLFKG